jgi:hypothetical protein
MMITVTSLAIVAITAVIITTTSDGPSRSRKDDASSTTAYMQARYSLERTIEALLPVSRAAVDRVVIGFSMNCPDVLRKAPIENGIGARQREEGGTLSLSTRNLLLLEIVTAIDVASHGASDTAIDRFANTVRELQWSDPRLTNLIHSFGNVEMAMLKRQIPNVCQDMKAWVASDYRKIPVSAEASEPNVETTGVALLSALRDFGCEIGYPQKSILQLLTPYQRSADELTSRVKRLEARIAVAESDFIGRAVAHAEHIVGLPGTRSGARLLSNSSKAKSSGRQPEGRCTGHGAHGVLPVTGSSHRIANGGGR